MIGRSWTTSLAAVAMLVIAWGAMGAGAEPFGRSLTEATVGRLSSTWSRLQSEMVAEEPVIAQCRAAPKMCPSPAAQKLIELSHAGDGFIGLSRLGRINRAVNLSMAGTHYTGMRAQMTTWTSPLESLERGAGDCKQYAVVKYAALRQAGYAADDLQIVIVDIPRRQSTHAAVAVQHEGVWYILDNLSLAVVDSRELRNYTPLLAFDQRGVHAFTVPTAVAGMPCNQGPDGNGTACRCLPNDATGLCHDGLKGRLMSARETR